MNLICGLIGVMFAIRSRLDLAFYWMLAAAACDFLDGWVARKLNAVSALGKELDSLCDLVSFGVLPGLMLSFLMQMLRFCNDILTWTPLFFLGYAAALRLARFNTDPRQQESFLGLPVPASALLCGALSCFCCFTPTGFVTTWASGWAFLPVLSFILAVLQVSSIPMFSLKFHRGDDRTVRIKRWTLLGFVLVSVAFCIVFRHHWSLAVVLTLLFYILNNLVYALFKL